MRLLHHTTPPFPLPAKPFGLFYGNKHVRQRQNTFPATKAEEVNFLLITSAFQNSGLPSRLNSFASSPQDLHQIGIPATPLSVQVDDAAVISSQPINWSKRAGANTALSACSGKNKAATSNVSRLVSVRLMQPLTTVGHRNAKKTP